MTTTTPPDRAHGSTLSTEYLLTRLSVAFSRRRAYPAAHPLVRAAETQVYDALAATLAERGRIMLIVGKEELFVDEEATAFSSGVARDLSVRLRSRGVGSLAFDRATTPESLLAAITWLAFDADKAEGEDSNVEPPPLAGVTIARFAYGRLALGNEHWSQDKQGSAIWRVLASIALVDGEDELEESVLVDDPREIDPNRAGDDIARKRAPSSGPLRFPDTAKGRPTTNAVDAQVSAAVEAALDAVANAGTGPLNAVGPAEDKAPPSDATAEDALELPPDIEAGDLEDEISDADPEDVAAGMERRLSRDGYARRVAFVLLRVADEVAHAPPAQRAALGERLRVVLGALRTSSVGTIIKSVGVGADQRKFMSQVIEALPVGAIIEWLETAAQATEQDLSNPLLRLLAKLSARTQGAVGTPGVEGTFRDAARGLSQGWTLDVPEPSDSVALLDQLSRFEATSRSAPRGAMPDAGATRILQISLEVDQFGEDAQDAAQKLLDEGRLHDLMQWIADAPGRAAAEALRNYISSPAAIRATLVRDPLDQVAARALLATLDENSCDVLLEVLCDAESRTTRRLIYDRLRDFGPALAPRLSARLEGAPWYFVRNLLALMRDTANVDGAAADLAGATLFRYLSHEQEQVRVEALRLLLEDPAARGLAIRQALGDMSERVLRLALTNLGTNEGQAHLSVVTPDVEQRLLRLIDAGAHAEDLLSRAVGALVDASPSMGVRDRLLAIATRRTMVLRRVVLADVQPIVIAALEVLAARYSKDAKVAGALKLAAAHQDSRIRDAVKRTANRTRAA